MGHCSVIPWLSLLLKMEKKNPREQFIEFYQQLHHNKKIRTRIEKMISYRERSLAKAEMTMKDRVSIMKESNVQAINQFMEKQLKKEAKKWISSCDLSLLIGLN